MYVGSRLGDSQLVKVRVSSIITSTALNCCSFVSYLPVHESVPSYIWWKNHPFSAQCWARWKWILCSGDGEIHKPWSYLGHVCCWPWKTRSRTGEMRNQFIIHPVWIALLNKKALLRIISIAACDLLWCIQRRILKDNPQWYWNSRTCQYWPARNKRFISLNW